jgi:predicted dehydrogenase
MGGIGMGSQGMSNLSAFLRPGVQFIAVCDVDRKHLKRAKRTIDGHYGNHDCVAYLDLRELLARTDLDAISIATPDHWHAYAAIRAARAGLDIYGEKPIGHDLREGRAIVEAVERHGRIWQTGSWQRSIANFHHAAELVRNGRLGKVAHVEIGLPDGNAGPHHTVQPVPPELDWDLWLGPAPWQPYRGVAHWDWRWVLDWGGGQLVDWIGHHCDIALWALDLEDTGPVKLSGTGVFPSEGFYDAPTEYEIDYTFASGLTMKVANQSRLEMGMGTRWIGENGNWIHVARGRQSSNPPQLWDEVMGAEEVRLERSRDHVGNFLEGVRTRRPTITPASVAHRAASVGQLGQVAMLTGRTLHWDPVAEVVTNDPSANALLGRAPRQPWSLT